MRNAFCASGLSTRVDNPHFFRNENSESRDGGRLVIIITDGTTSDSIPEVDVGKALDGENGPSSWRRGKGTSILLHNPGIAHAGITNGVQGVV
jgi:hypothetical protein